LARLATTLTQAGHVVRTTREPGGAPSAEIIRTLLVEGEPDRWQPMTEALLHFAARRDHVTKVIRPALARGAWVVSDRFTDSTMAYQGYGHRLGAEPIAALADAVLGEFQPDLTFILDLPVAMGLARAAMRRGSETRYERMDRAFHERVRQGFLDIAAREPARCVVIDASADEGAVAAALMVAVAERLSITR
jgi:dTMP kinase